MAEHPRTDSVRTCKIADSKRLIECCERHGHTAEFSRSSAIRGWGAAARSGPKNAGPCRCTPRLGFSSRRRARANYPKRELSTARAR